MTIFGELAGTDADRLKINFIIGDIGVAPPGISEFYFVQVGTSLDPEFDGLFGFAAGGGVRNADGEGPNLGIEVGDVIATVSTSNIVTLDNIIPADALTSGNLEFTTNAIAGTLSHEIGHTLSLSHICVDDSVQPTGAAPIMATSTKGLTNQLRLTDREFSLSGYFAPNENSVFRSPRFQVSQLACAIGPLSDLEEKNTFYFVGPEGGIFEDENNWNDEPDGSGSAPADSSIESLANVGLNFNLVIDGVSVTSKLRRLYWRSRCRVINDTQWCTLQFNGNGRAVRYEWTTRAKQ